MGPCHLLSDPRQLAGAAGLSQPGSGFMHLEVFQYLEVEGTGHIVFCCDTGG